MKFTCTNCPKRPSRLARYEPPVVSATSSMKEDSDLEAGEIEDMDEDADMDMSDEMDDSKEDKDL
ncbi:MAG: hypothetical protein ACRYFS_18295 [Janthinobacterium lividum]